MADSAALKASIDALTAAVAKVAAEVAALKNQPPPVLDQAQLDETVSSVQGAADALNGL